MTKAVHCDAFERRLFMSPLSTSFFNILIKTLSMRITSLTGTELSSLELEGKDKAS
jgi:hypothetical protein